MLLTGDQHMLKQSNRGALLRQICAARGYSRAELANRVNLNKSTVSLLVRELIDEDWVVEQEIMATEAMGRRPTPLILSTKKWVLLGLDLAIEHICLAVTDLTGQILIYRTEEYLDRNNAIASVDQATRLAIKAAEELLQLGKEALGLGYALHGIVDEMTGTLHRGSQMGWHDVKVQHAARQVLANTIIDRIPIYVRSEADSCALAEYEFVDHLSAQSLAYISAGYGVHSGLVVDGQLLTGYRGLAGDIGHTTLVLNGRECSCGRKGCAETLIGIRYWTEHADALDSDLVSDINLRKLLIDRLLKGHADVLDAVNKAAQTLETLLQNFWTSVAPQRIVLGGAVFALAPGLLTKARIALQEYAARASLPLPDVVGSHFGEQSAAVGACALVRHRLTNVGMHSIRTPAADHEMAQRVAEPMLRYATV
jgi:predicted NBD/HSP70 family sugar kinase/DNA-binding XRE family transcriptional regulator